MKMDIFTGDACLLKMFSKWIFFLSPPQDISCLVIEQRIFPIPVPKQSKKFSRVKELKEEFLIWVSYFPNSQESKSNTFCFFKKLKR